MLTANSGREFLFFSLSKLMPIETTIIKRKHLREKLIANGGSHRFSGIRFRQSAIRPFTTSLKCDKPLTQVSLTNERCGIVFVLTGGC